MPTRLRRFAVERAFLRAYARTTARAAAAEAGPVLAVSMVVTAIFFGPDGMRAQDVIALARASPAVRAALLGSWVLVVAPAARVLVRGPGARTLRTLPVSTGTFAVGHFTALLAMHVPWIALWALGASPAAAVAWSLGALALVTCITAGSATALAWTSGATLAIALVAIAPGAPRGGSTLAAVLASALAAATYAVAVRDAWRRGLSTATRGPRMPLRGTPPVVALALVQLTLTARQEGVRCLRTLALAALGGIAAEACARAYGLDGMGRAHALGAASMLPVAAGVAVVGPSLARGERALSWLVRTTGRSRLALHFASRAASHGFTVTIALVACLVAREELALVPVSVAWAVAENPSASALLGVGPPRASLLGVVRVVAHLAVVLVAFATWGAGVLWAMVALACGAETALARRAARAEGLP